MISHFVSQFSFHSELFQTGLSIFTIHCKVLLTHWYLIVESQHWKRQKNLHNLFKVNNKDTGTTF